MESERPGDDVEAWAERERKRREEWLRGPTEEEKAAWARSRRWRAAVGLGESDLPPSREEVDAWAESERRRRAEWASGPTEDEKRAWSRRRAAESPRPEPISETAAEEELFDLAFRVMRQAELAGKGSLYAFSRAPLRALSYLVRAGRAFDDELSRPPKKGRVPY